MKRIGILTAGGDTPALNATIYGAVTRANQLKIEIVGLMKGFSALVDPQVPHVILNPLYREIPELDPTYGGTILGSSRQYIDPLDRGLAAEVTERLARLKIEGLICIGGDGTLCGMQALRDALPIVMAPKTIDNDLGLNSRDEPNQWRRVALASPAGFAYERGPRAPFELAEMVNYVTPGYATAVFVSASGVQRLRTTAESHRRVAIVEVMGRQSGYIALGAAYGQPDLVLIPEQPLDVPQLVERVRQVYELQQNVVIVCGEGLTTADGSLLVTPGARDPAGNPVLGGAADTLRGLLIDGLGDEFFRKYRRIETAREAIFTRKVGHTQRGGRPLAFDRFHAAQLGAKATDLLVDGLSEVMATLQWRPDEKFCVDHVRTQDLCDPWGVAHPRTVHPQMYDPQRMQPSRLGAAYLVEIFDKAIGADDVEFVRQTIFDSGNLYRPYRSVNTDVAKRVRYL